MMIPPRLAYDLAKQRQRDLIAAADGHRRCRSSSSGHGGPARRLRRLAELLGAVRKRPGRPDEPAVRSEPPAAGTVSTTLLFHQQEQSCTEEVKS